MTEQEKAVPSFDSAALDVLDRAERNINLASAYLCRCKTREFDTPAMHERNLMISAGAIHALIRVLRESRSKQDAPATEAKPCRDCVEWQKRGAKTCVRHSAEPSRKEE